MRGFRAGAALSLEGMVVQEKNLLVANCSPRQKRCGVTALIWTFLVPRKLEVMAASRILLLMPVERAEKNSLLRRCEGSTSQLLRTESGPYLLLIHHHVTATRETFRLLHICLHM